MEASEASIISNGLFDDIFDGVTDPKNNLIETPSFLIAETPKRSFEEFNLEKISEYCVGKKDPNLTIYQFKTEKQRTRLTCGYNAMYNGYLIYKLVTSDLPNNIFNPNMLHNKYQFWLFANKLKEVLLQEQKNYGRDYYPWSIKNIKEMIIERIYMETLMKGSPSFHSIPDISLKLLENAFLWPAALDKIQSIFDEFRKGDEKINVFCLGCLNHWITLVVNRYAPGKLEAIVADSRNWVFFGLNDDQLHNFITERIEDWTKYNPSLAEPKRKIQVVSQYVTSCSEAHRSVMLVIDCCMGKRNFIVEALEGSVHGIMKQYVLAKQDIYMFMNNFFHPTQIKQGILHLFQTYEKLINEISKKTMIAFKEWLNMAREDLSQREEKLPKYDFNSPKLVHIDNDLIWKMTVEKEMNRVMKDQNIDTVPLTKRDIENKVKMLVVLDEFDKILGRIKE